MVLIYSKFDDDFVNQVIDCLEVDFVRISDRNKIFINEICISEKETVFNADSEFFSRIDLKKLKTIWFNGGVASTFGNDYENECYRMLVDSFLSSKRNINRIGRIHSNFEITKLDTLLEAKRQGFEIPDTLLTSNKDKLFFFHKKYHSQNGIVCKRISDRYFYENDNNVYDFTPTFLVEPNIFNDIPDRFAISLFQERIIPDFEIRVIFVNGVFYAASIHTFDSDVDYRSKSSNNIRIIPFILPKEVRKKLKNVFGSLKINYGSADLILSNNKYYFLEINPTGQISFVNESCNFYLENMMSKLITDEV